MAKFSLRKYEDQATASAILAVCAMLMLIPLAYLVFRNYNATYRWIMYNAESPRKFLVMIATAATGGTAFLALYLGLNSLGQRRNTNQRRSWQGFILGSVGMLFTILLFACWFFLKRANA